MASLLLPASSLLSSSSFPPPFLQSTPRNLTKNLSFLKSKKALSVGRTALDDSPVLDPASSSEEAGSEVIASLKLKLLSAVSGLNRGLAASQEDLQRAESAAKELEAVGGVVDLSKDLDKLQGRWKLLYSSAFSSRTLGGSRPGPPIGRLLPITLGQSSSELISSAKILIT
ncbi:putative plastid-lipid-associated protein 6, chloroplastic [Iris pallida]|uniref:Plastid-lipid-associated protein 6, chloroplastic n=1 Tax=Iris pallida TaxID=29817 RepID=A0AAX6FJE2_IRIPA|nr:putative plastid-lipid-associated protein 6, chloroplastic [Iris pallida]